MPLAAASLAPTVPTPAVLADPVLSLELAGAWAGGCCLPPLPGISPLWYPSCRSKAMPQGL